MLLPDGSAATSLQVRIADLHGLEKARLISVSPSFATMYMGMSPFEAPGTYSLLQYTELTEGIWYPRGGFWQ
jgi:phytoene dehydrogenase-like protein